MFYLTTHSTHFIYGYMASDIWLRTILIVRKVTCCCHIGYSLQLTAIVLLYAPSHRQDSTYPSLCYTSHGALAGTRNSSMGSPHEGSIWRPITPWANALTTELHLIPKFHQFVFAVKSYAVSCYLMHNTHRHTHTFFLFKLTAIFLFFWELQLHFCRHLVPGSSLSLLRNFIKEYQVFLLFFLS